MERESSLGGRLRRLMEEEGLSYEQLGERLGMNPQTLNRYVLGQREPKIGTASAMAAALGVDPLWLLGYDVPMAAEQRVEGWATADVAEPEEHFFLRVTGDSMINAGIRDGDLVLLRRQDTAENGQIVACLVDGEDATLKRFRRQRDMVLLQPENPVYEPKLVPLSDFETGAARIVGVAVRLVREL